MLRNVSAFPLCNATDIFWNKYCVSRGSCATAMILFPNSVTNSIDKSFHEPSVSIAIEVKWWDLESSAYLAVLLDDGQSATADALVGVSSTYDWRTCWRLMSKASVYCDTALFSSLSKWYCLIERGIIMWRGVLFLLESPCRHVLSTIDHCTANTEVWLTCCTSKAVANGYADRFICQYQIHCYNRWRMEPITRAWSSHRSQSGPVCRCVGVIIQKSLKDRCSDRRIPSFLYVLWRFYWKCSVCPRHSNTLFL